MLCFLLLHSCRMLGLALMAGWHQHGTGAASWRRSHTSTSSSWLASSALMATSSKDITCKHRLGAIMYMICCQQLAQGNLLMEHVVQQRNTWDHNRPWYGCCSMQQKWEKIRTVRLLMYSCVWYGMQSHQIWWMHGHARLENWEAHVRWQTRANLPIYNLELAHCHHKVFVLHWPSNCKNTPGRLQAWVALKCMLMPCKFCASAQPSHAGESSDYKTQYCYCLRTTSPQMGQEGDGICRGATICLPVHAAWCSL